MGTIWSICGSPLFGVTFGSIITLNSNNDEDIVISGLIATGVVALICLYYIITIILTKINLKHGEYLLMQELSEGNTIYLTNKRIISKWVTKTNFEFNIKSKDTNFQFWKNIFGNKKGIIIKKKYEKPIKTKLEKPDKWYDKIMEMRNS